MAIARFLAALMVSTAGGAFALVALLHWSATYTHGPRTAPWVASRDLYWMGILDAWILSHIAWRVAAAIATEPSTPYLGLLPMIVLIVVAIISVRRIGRRRSPGPQRSSPGGELVGNGDPTIDRGVLSLLTATWPVWLLVAGGVVVGVALALILRK